MARCAHLKEKDFLKGCKESLDDPNYFYEKCKLDECRDNSIDTPAMCTWSSHLAMTCAVNKYFVNWYHNDNTNNCRKFEIYYFSCRIVFSLLETITV